MNSRMGEATLRRYQAIRDAKPDVVLTDLQMKPTSGIELIAQLRQRQVVRLHRVVVEIPHGEQLCQHRVHHNLVRPNLHRQFRQPVLVIVQRHLGFDGHAPKQVAAGVGNVDMAWRVVARPPFKNEATSTDSAHTVLS